MGIHMKHEDCRRCNLEKDTSLLYLNTDWCWSRTAVESILYVLRWGMSLLTMFIINLITIANVGYHCMDMRYKEEQTT